MHLNHTKTTGKKQTKLAVLFASAALLTLSSVNANESGNIVEVRQQKFKEMGKSMKTINEQLKSANADITLIQQAAKLLSDHANELENWFPVGTGQDAKLDTDALPEIWLQKTEFNDSAQKLVNTTATLAQQAQAGQTSALAKSLKEVKDSCSACHKNFRAD